ncbi:MAG: precorrin-8X methylmutase [Gloeomargarita sp. SKYBB_i_bin120]|nr:precorrin-8X methylmutase [Gloeomargarita sp. SKYG98]MCS7291602.1 precorrin-8X methylmutase [Gloeomargarita sp. SKYB120]MDW8177162.1 precorrin-8X methylmutase [Gloeomargarita sp. SKYBB_i_bin120]
MTLDPITAASFATIDREIGPHPWGWRYPEYIIIRRVIHATGDFSFKHLVHFSPHAVEFGLRALRQGAPVIADVGLVAQGIKHHLATHLPNPLVNALDLALADANGETRAANGMETALRQYPRAVVAIGNAPTALIKLCQLFPDLPAPPALVVGAPVGFVRVVEAKAMLQQTPVPRIWVAGRRGGSPIAAAIVNALIDLAVSEPSYQATRRAD